MLSNAMLIALLLLDMKHAGQHWKDAKGWHYTTRDGRTVGKDCNPCVEKPAPGDKAVKPKTWVCMAKDCDTVKKDKKP